MEGNERLTLEIPGEATEDSYGQQRASEPTRLFVYARRQDRGGREGRFADTLAGVWSTRFEIRRFPSTEAITEKWGLVDGYGRRYDIEAISEAMGRRTHWWIYAVRRN